jgi:hypothetical protein
MAGRALNLDAKKVTKSAPAELPPPVPVSEDDIAILAHQLWIERGCPLGSDQDDWFNAERQLKGK